MDAAQALALYQKIRSKENRLPEMDGKTVSLTHETSRVPTSDAAYAALQQFKATQGWIGFQSVNRGFTASVIPEINVHTGVLLSAEAVNANGESLHIRYDGTGDWLVTRYAITEGSDYLSDFEVHIGSDTALGDLRYRRLWRIDSGRGIEPFVACFIGFTQN